ncbi:type-2 ice-structuring protein-like isoform X3 [Lates japonicus]|uniref:Type-2 ice-structuring protein-like isoform X3 n=1 Tax=Lates japonicus TaxID=270547 RepID=A0AAD3M253_LATJO|nr:type-2 ice-structuring protein-like isoform X3 [Lates japonicus]
MASVPVVVPMLSSSLLSAPSWQKTLTVSLIVCTLITLTRAAALPYEENEHGTMDPMIIVDPFPFMTTTPPPPPLPETTTALPETTMSWADAQKNCETMNSNLASVHSDEEYQLIQKVVLVASHGSGPTWIGGSDAQKEKLWFWIDGTTFKYENWCEGQPDDFKILHTGRLKLPAETAAG